jgi:glycosyltransferase involved in cell wall biosynthesis
MPVKNGMPYIRETLASIERQTYSNWEIAVWDNGSTDGTLEELNEWIPRRLPGRVISDRPMSLGTSLAALVETSSTELCARIDADDLNYPMRLEKQVAYMRQHPRVGVVGTQFEFIDEDGKVEPGAWRQPLEDAEIRWRLRWANSLNHPSTMLKRSVVIAAGNYQDCMPYVRRPDRPWPEDHDLWMRMSVICEMANLPDFLLKYRRLASSVTGGASEDPTPLFEAVAERNASILFGGMDAKAALQFRGRVSIFSSDVVTLRDIVAQRQVARATAAWLEKPSDYFSSTSLYSDQLIHLRSRYLQQTPVGRAILSVKRGVQHRLGAYGPDNQAASR